MPCLLASTSDPLRHVEGGSRMLVLSPNTYTWCKIVGKSGREVEMVYGEVCSQPAVLLRRFKERLSPSQWYAAGWNQSYPVHAEPHRGFFGWFVWLLSKF
jgi:hypothetical protein